MNWEFTGRSYSALCAECLVVALGRCSLSVAANVHAEGCRPLVLAFDIFMKPSLSHWGVRTSEGVDVWPLRARSIAVEAAAADVPDNRPLSDGSAGPPWPEGRCRHIRTLASPTAAGADDDRRLLGYGAV